MNRSDYFAKYEGKTREIIDLLLDKYAEHGITAIDDTGDLQVSPFANVGTPLEIVELFGGRESYLQVVREIQRQLYATGPELYKNVNIYVFNTRFTVFVDKLRKSSKIYRIYL